MHRIDREVKLSVVSAERADDVVTVLGRVIVHEVEYFERADVIIGDLIIVFVVDFHREFGVARNVSHDPFLVLPYRRCCIGYDRRSAIDAFELIDRQMSLT